MHDIPSSPPPSEVPAPHYAPDLDIWGSHWAWVPLFGRWVAVWRRLPPYRGPWMSVRGLADRIGVADSQVRGALERGGTVHGWSLDSRLPRPTDRVRLGLRDDCQLVVRITHHNPPITEAIVRTERELHQWTTAIILAQLIGVTNESPSATISAAGARNGLCEGYRIERREATPHERESFEMSRSAKYVYRVEPVEERGAEAVRKAKQRAEHDPLMDEADCRLNDIEERCNNCEVLASELRCLEDEYEQAVGALSRERRRIEKLKSELEGSKLLNEKLNGSIDQLESELERENEVLQQRLEQLEAQLSASETTETADPKGPSDTWEELFADYIGELFDVVERIYRDDTRLRRDEWLEIYRPSVALRHAIEKLELVGSFAPPPCSFCGLDVSDERLIWRPKHAGICNDCVVHAIDALSATGVDLGLEDFIAEAGIPNARRTRKVVRHARHTPPSTKEVERVTDEMRGANPVTFDLVWSPTKDEALTDLRQAVWDIAMMPDDRDWRQSVLETLRASYEGEA